MPKVTDNSSLHEKARYFQKDLIDKHFLEGLYISIVPSVPHGTKLKHTVDEPGNVIHAGVWTGRYLAGVGYQYAVTKDPWVREHGWEILRGLRTLQEVTGKPGLLARGFVRGHGPVEGFERGGGDSAEWHQGQDRYADYRWYGDVSVDNFNAVLYGYAVYYDLAADEKQKKFIAQDVERLMTHLLDNHCRIIDVDGEVTTWGHVGIDPDPARDEYYRKHYASYLRRFDLENALWRPPLRSSLLLLPDLLIADRITGNPRYKAFYRRVVERFKDNPDIMRERGPYSLERVARTNHSSEGQAYEALYNLIRYEQDPELLRLYRSWVMDLWEMNWMEGNSLFAFMTLALLPEYRAPFRPGELRATPAEVPHGVDGLRLAIETLKLFPIDRLLRPVMNSIRPEIELNPHASRHNQKISARPLPINERPHDNEYEWKGDPYQLDHWLKPDVTAFRYSCDDPLVAWFTDSNGKIYMTRDGGKTWQDMTFGLMGARMLNFAVSPKRTFVLYAQTDQGICITRDGGMSWRVYEGDEKPTFEQKDFTAWQGDEKIQLRIRESGELVRTTDGGKTEEPCMQGWRIPRASYVYHTPTGFIAGGPGGCYHSSDGKRWREMQLWPELETGAADFLHAYWMGRYYGFITGNESAGSQEPTHGRRGASAFSATYMHP